MAALFACTKCHTRHPFEDLTKGEQFCKACVAETASNAKSTPTSATNTPSTSAPSSTNLTKCSYCRVEFMPEDSKSSAVCRRCSQDLKTYGKPKACELCNITAAFMGSKCSRCVHSEKKYGPPQPCHQCKQKCAFDKTKDGQLNKLLCWLCTLSHKRVLERTAAKRKHMTTGSDGKPVLNTDGQATSQESDAKHKHHKNHHHHHRHKEHSDEKHSGHKHKHHHHHHKSGGHPGSTSGQRSGSVDDNKSHQQRLAELTSSGSLESKRIKLDTSTTSTNGVSTPSRQSTADMDPSSSDHVIAIQLLRDQLEQLKKQLKEKDQQLMEKEKKLTELKANMYETEKEQRQKLQDLQKQYDNTREDLMGKTRTLQKQVSTLTKLNKNTKSGRQSTPTLSP